MINRITSPNIGITGIRRMAAIPILAIALAFATLVTFQSGTAFADTGSDSANTQTIVEDQIDPGDIITGQCLLPGIPC